MTIEDPIEFLHAHKKCIVNQRELGTDATSFATALKAALRQDPDVILVGEMRDLETISTALTAAETGHLVLRHPAHAGRRRRRSTASSTSSRPHQQDQVRVQLSVDAAGRHHPAAAADAPTAPDACVACEVLVPTPAVRNLIREGKTHQISSVLQTGAAAGMQTMDTALATLVRAGKITPEARRGALLARRTELRRLLGAPSLAAA